MTNVLDTSWQRVRDKLPSFVNLARDLNATDVVPASQSLVLSVLSPTSAGWCYGLSMDYIIGVYDRRSPASILAEGYKSAGTRKWMNDRPQSSSMDDQDNLDVVRIGQWTKRIGVVHDHQKYGVTQANDDLESTGLKANPGTWDKTYSDLFNRFGKVAKAAVAAGRGAVLINSPNHTMAVVMRDRFSFYDPNFGSVTFSSTVPLETFITRWLEKPYIQAAYKGAMSERKGSPPAKSLVLRLRTFT